MISKLFVRRRVDKAKLHTLKSCPWKNVTLPQAAAAVPTMLLPYEQHVLFWLANQYVNGTGRIVDGGCFLGGSTAALASGLAARKDRPFEKAIASYDLFRVEPYTLEKFCEDFTDPTVDASFRPDFECNIAPWAKYIDVREGDAVQLGWTGEPIEVLFIDLAKTWELNDFVIEQFFSRLIPGHSVIIQQDYMWAFTPWIHITMELMAPSVTIIDSMLCSVVYLLTGPVPPKLLRSNLQKQLSRKAQLRLMDRAVNRWYGQQRAMVELARVTLWRDLLGADVARLELDRILTHNANDSVVQSCGKRVAAFLGEQRPMAA